jgi:hypothetical protein
MSKYLIAELILSHCIYFLAKILAEDVCENNGTPLTGTHQICDCPTGFKGFDCSEKGDFE